VTRDLLFASLVVEAALVAAADAADCFSPVEESDRLIVLPFAVLDDQAVPGVVAVDRQAPAAPLAASVADQPLETVLAARIASSGVERRNRDALRTVSNYTRRRGRPRKGGRSTIGFRPGSASPAVAASR
jgi:hypothetical protein